MNADRFVAGVCEAWCGRGLVGAALAMLVCAGGMALLTADSLAQAITTPGQAFEAGKVFANSPKGKAAAAAPAASASATAGVPKYSPTKPAESSAYQDGKKLIGSNGMTKQANCVGYLAGNAYEQQECNAINFLKRLPGERASFVVDPRSDRMIINSKATVRSPGVIAATSTSVCTMERVAIPGTFLAETCQESQTIARVQCNKVLVVACPDPSDGCDAGGIVPGSWAGDMATTWTAGGDGSYLLQFGTLGDNYWNAPRSGQIFDRTLTFAVTDPGLITLFKLTRVAFDDWLLVRVNGHIVYVGPLGGDRLELATTDVCGIDADGNPVCTPTQMVQYSATGFSPADLSTNWNFALDVDLRPYLVAGTNTIETRTIVGDGG